MTEILTLFALLPWFLMVAALVFLVRRRPRLAEYARLSAPVAAAGGEPVESASVPRVSIILPTRNDAGRVGPCLATLLGSEYPDFEVLVVDHGSVDGTREIVQALSRRAPTRVRLIRVGRIPEDRPWRAWACLRGCRASDGDLLLVTEPGTVHEPELVGRAVSALEAEGADLLSVQPRLRMHGFWERLVTPHVWLVMHTRFPSARLVNRSRSPRNAFAHHQFMLFRREAYEAFGGHSIMGRGDVEDLAIPQAAVRAGQRLFLVHGDAYLETRMYRRLDDLATEWAGAVPPASRTTFVPWAAVFAPWIVASLPVLLFVVPVAALIVGLVRPGHEVLTMWGLWTTLLSLGFWLVVYAVHRIRPAYAVAFPVGALATSVIFVRSAIRA